jgi:hypothetical protein
MKNNCVIYDYETLGKDPYTCVAVALAAITFNEKRFTEDPYTWDELVLSSRMIKFDAQDQVVNYNRKIEMDTVKWWNDQGAEARKIIDPTPNDAPLSELPRFFSELIEFPREVKKVYTRGNTFDPVITDTLLKKLGREEVFPWWTIRDTRSMIEGLAWGSDVGKDFIPEGLDKVFVKHNPVHDIAIDIMRIQFLVRAIS